MNRKKIKLAVILALLAVVAAGLAYSLYITLKQNPSRGIVTCPSEGNCTWTAHIHAFIPIEICGEEFRLPIEVGSLESSHSHEGENIIHWHNKLPYDKETQQILDTQPLTLGAFFDEIEIPFDDDQIGEKQNGDLCPQGLAGTVKIFVNGKLIGNARNYTWQDKDVIQIFFDSRTTEEVETEIKKNPSFFPKLGRG